MLKVRGDVQHYAWGDGATIPSLLGREPGDLRWAELWIGTHPLMPSRVRTPGGVRPLRDVSGRLSFLLKVLAADQPLSLQVHPDADQAAEGFADEERSGVALDDPRRIYRDKEPKPEVLCALTSFEVLAGFRSRFDSAVMLRSIGGPGDEIADYLDEHGLAATVRHLLLDQPEFSTSFGEACSAANEPDGSHIGWLRELSSRYPGDPAIAVAALMNFLVLRPGEALYVQPGTLHSYLRGAGVELMRSSDNVIRAGFTTKPREHGALFEALDLRTAEPPRSTAHTVAPGVVQFDTPGSGFQLWKIELDGQMTLSASFGPEILLCTDGDAGALIKGEACYIRPGETYSLAGRATLYRASKDVL